MKEKEEDIKFNIYNQSIKYKYLKSNKKYLSKKN